MDNERTERLLREIRTNAGGTAGRDAAKSELDALVGVELAEQLAVMTQGLHDTKRILGERIIELSGELGRLRGTLDNAADSASRQTASIIRWTRWYAIATFVLVLVAFAQTWLTGMKAQ